MSRRAFHSFRASQRGMNAPQKGVGQTSWERRHPCLLASVSRSSPETSQARMPALPGSLPYLRAAILILSRLGAAGGKYPSLLRKLLFAYMKRHQIFAGRRYTKLSAWRAKSSTRGARAALRTVGVAQIPDDAIDPRFRPTIQRANDLAARVGHCERDFFLGVLSQKVSEGQSVRLVLRHGEAVAIEAIVAQRAFTPPCSRPHGEKMRISGEQIFIHLAQRRDVSDPDSATVGSYNQITFARMNYQVVNGHERHVAFQRRPMFASVQRYVDPYVITDEEQVWILLIFKNDVDWPLRKSGCNRSPGRAEIGGLVEKGTEVVLTMARFGDVCHARFVMRSEDARHPCVLRSARTGDRFRDVGPTAARVPGHLRLAVVSADPDHARLRGRFVNRGDRAILNGRARRTDLRGVVCSQIGADLLPGLAAVARAEQRLSASVERLRVMRRDTQRRHPVEAQH